MKVDDVVRIIRAMRELKLSLHEMSVLLCLFEFGGNATVAMGGVREMLGLAPACMSVLCRGLEVRGLLQIESSTHDRRTKGILLTAAGRELCRRVQRSLA